ncbi:hypothetical protein [Paraburkholderia sp. BL6665CI2N2]|uniref:hypothetical protein n=1 Tax=Paraburkholderia sp. BL6665CI2N2 TaxID=1938806 RepID=UPI000EB3EC4A|nr:hypothetical protein [Paraburkholderia sp. BL6665CI2N2]
MNARDGSVRQVAGSQVTSDGRSNTTGVTHGPDKPRIWTTQSLRKYFEELIGRELQSCRACMSEANWIEHRDWIEEHARVCLREAVERRAARGEL